MQRPTSLDELDDILNNPIQAGWIEAERRLCVIGPLAGQPFNLALFLERAKDTMVAIEQLKLWHEAFTNGGLGALMPNWVPLDVQSKQEIKLRLQQLGECREAVTFSNTQIGILADQLGKSNSTARRLIQRYQQGGMWGLCSKHSPQKKEKKNSKQSPRDLGVLDEGQLQKVYDRYGVIEPLINKGELSDADVADRAKEKGLSRSTIWDYIRRYRERGMSGLADKRRSDIGNRHGLSERIVNFVEQTRLSHPDWLIARVFDEVKSVAERLGEKPPSLWQVRDICNKIPEPIKALADGREGKYKNKYQLTYPIRFSGVVYQVDHTQAELLVIDPRPDKKGAVRLWYTVVLDSLSRLVVAYRFSYGHPNKHTVAMVLRDAFLATPGGIPDEIWVDRGKELISNHVREFVRECGSELHPCAPRQPKHRGRGENFFGTVKSRLWSTLDGYVDENPVERNPNATAVLTGVEQVAHFEAFIQQYNNETHSSHGQTPLEYWQENCFPFQVVDHHRLDLLLKESKSRTVSKQGINFGGQKYWHPDLGILVGEHVLIRFDDTGLSKPETIEVFHKDKHICTAFTFNSAQGHDVTRDTIALAQQEQRQHYRKQITSARQGYASTVSTVGEPETVSESDKEKALLHLEPRIEPKHSSDKQDKEMATKADNPLVNMASFFRQKGQS